MTIIATLGPTGSDCFVAAKQYNPNAEQLQFNRIKDVIEAFDNGTADYALIPIYNTREGEIKEYFRLLDLLNKGYWMDNVVLPIHLSLGALVQEEGKRDFKVIVGRSTVFRQCEEYIQTHFPDATLMTVRDIEASLQDIAQHQKLDYAVIESEQLVKQHNFELLDREVVSHNRTRFALLGKQASPSTGYDATAIITRPLSDRVGMLYDILGEFTRRGINILDLRSENDIKTQKLQIYIEVEGHFQDPHLKTALQRIEENVIQESNSLRLLGSFPRIDMRVKKIKSFGFIGSGAMSTWFTDRLENEGYTTLLTGRSTPLTPEEMIPQVDVVAICVPISVTVATIKKYGASLREGQALILLAGESENTLQAALESTVEGVEVMLVHNLWGPQALTMKDKNASIVRTHRSGSFCSEFEAFLYKHGADIYQDTPNQHDLLMGVSQKLPTTISVALALTLKQHKIDSNDIGTHSTLTSIYGILAMARIHNQNPRTYAEIMATGGDGRKIVRSFIENILSVTEMAENSDIEDLCKIMEQNSEYFTPAFLELKMQQAKAVDETLSDAGLRNGY